MTSESERTAREPAAAWPARTFNHATDVSGIAASAVHARLHACLQSCPDVRARAVTEPSPMAVFRHTDTHARRRVIAWNRRPFVSLNATSTIERSQS